jgi:hypothetical protein
LDEDLPESNEEAGTSIEVTELFPGIAEEFGLDNFITRLRQTLSAAHQNSMERGLAVTLNGLPLDFSVADLLVSDELAPAFRSITSHHDNVDVFVKMYAGLATSDPAKAGWNVFCNGRLILEADKSRKTGWGDSNPNYHNEYARFRGFVFFDSDKAALLPWNTTKSDVDADSPVYRAVRLQMIQMMRPIIDFLIRVAAEKKRQDNDDPTLLETKIGEARPVRLTALPARETLLVPYEQARLVARNTVRICFNADRSHVDEVKKVLKVGTYRQVGEQVFEYYRKMECSE